MGVGWDSITVPDFAEDQKGLGAPVNFWEPIKEVGHRFLFMNF